MFNFRKNNNTPIRTNQDNQYLQLPNIFLFQDRRINKQIRNSQPKSKIKQLDLSTNTVDLKSDRKKEIIDNIQFQSRSLNGLNINNQPKTNQDSYLVLQELPYKFFGVFDGHGQYGHLVSTYIKFTLQKLLQNKTGDHQEMRTIYEEVCQMLLESNIDTQLSGSTGISVHINGNHLFCCNVGDSKAILGRRQMLNRYQCIRLNKIHKPIGQERDRIIRFGGRVEYSKDVFGRNKSPLRVWLQKEDVPGLAMTRSFGDKIGRQAGVIAIPDIFDIQLTKDDHFILVGSDGVFEYLSEEDICKTISRFYPLSIEKASDMLLQEILKSWKQINFGRDDVTFILIFRFT